MTGLQQLAAKAEEFAAQARAAADAQALYEAQFHGFHRGSRNHTAARYLVGTGGHWITPAEALAATGLHPSALTAVLDRLRRNGVEVTTRRNPDTARLEHRIAGVSGL